MVNNIDRMDIQQTAHKKVMTSAGTWTPQSDSCHLSTM